MAKKERCFCGSGKASKNCHRVASDSRAAHLFKLFEQVEHTVEDYFMDKESKPQCFSGCNNCCSDFFAVSEVELEIILDEIHNTWTEQEIANLYKKVMNNVRAFQVEHPDVDNAIQTQLDYEGDLYKYSSFKGGKTRTSFPCPLLNKETGRCSVYNKRPMVCRTHGTTHLNLDEKLNSIESTVCEYIPSRIQNNAVTPDVTDMQTKYEEIVNVTTEQGSLYVRKLPLFYGIHALASMQGYNPTKSTVFNRHNLDMSMQESNAMQLKKAAAMK
ncbi:YkgJ family cysteine cluster protein [Cohnella sp. AR92]|uniref:YkgJ family cysteine cluster protein n=1 Tax=Cohnella sp. AR92 TaxID=648716 RepID=UPI000F8E0D62|nr:YkgJ family cysteine cluster protein [Cohnella sp. AR92]RUS44609.1 YkgJ family cysteine cluster protein [Cohnella sp. AR92]